MSIGRTWAAFQVAAQDGQLSVETATLAAEQLQTRIRGFASGMMSQQHGARNVPSLLGKRNITEAMNMNLGHVPKPVYITQTVIQLFGPTPGCRKCLAGMSSERCYLPHTPECRERLTDLMRQDNRYRSVV